LFKNAAPEEMLPMTDECVGERAGLVPLCGKLRLMCMLASEINDCCILHLLNKCMIYIEVQSKNAENIVDMSS